jgi:TetR/AcrR family tetracycline transcriptional repressor
MAVARASGARRRLHRTELSKQAIVEAAARLYEHEGAAGVSMRRIARELGVAPMTLYGHVSGREEILEELVGRWLGAAWQPEVDARADPHGWIVEAADRLRALLVGEELALEVYLSHPVTHPVALARMRRILEVLRSCGLGPEEALAVYASIHTFTIGFAALAAARRRGAHPPATPEASELAGLVGVSSLRTGIGLILEGAQVRAQPAGRGKALASCRHEESAGEAEDHG